jgi:hypothetical protein
MWAQLYKPTFVSTWIGTFGAGAINAANYIGSKPYAVQFTGCGPNVYMDSAQFVYNSVSGYASCGSITVSNNATHNVSMPWGGAWVAITGFWQ